MEKVDYSNQQKDEEAACQAFLHNWELHTQILQSMFREAPPARPIVAVTEVLMTHVKGLYDVIAELQVQVKELETKLNNSIEGQAIQNQIQHNLAIAAFNSGR